MADAVNEKVKKPRAPRSTKSKTKKLKLTTPNKVMLVIIAILFVAAAVMGAYVFGVSSTKVETESKVSSLSLKNIGQLATQAGYYTSIQSLTKNRDFFGFVVPGTESSYIYSYDGVVKAGIDFEKIIVSVDDENKVVTLALPDVEVFGVEINEDSLKVYHSQDNIFTPLKIESFNESLTTMKAEVLDKAIANGLYESALSNAKLILNAFVTSFYGSDYEVSYITLNEYSAQSAQEEIKESEE